MVARSPGVHLPQPQAGLGAALAGAGGVSCLLLLHRLLRALPRTRARVLARTSRVVPSLSGALATLDLALLYDVLLARRWGASARVRSRSGGPRGRWALVHRDARRALRAPQPWLVLCAAVLVPYAFATAGAGRYVVLVTTATGLLCGPALCAGLRVVTRTDALARMLPFGDRAVRCAHLVLPAAGLLGFGLVSVGTVRPDLPWDGAVLLALACGLSALASTVHWVAAQPPDYGRPLVSTPAGGLPPGMIAGALKGFDVWALTALPLVYPPWGVLVSAVLALAVIGYHLEPHRPGR